MFPTNATSVANQGARNGMRVVRSWRAGNVYIPEIAPQLPNIQPLTYCGMSQETAIAAGLWILAGVAGASLAAARVRSETKLVKKQQSNAAQVKSVAADGVNSSETFLVQKQQSNAAQAESVAAVVETETTDTGAALPQDMPKKDVMMSSVTCAPGNMRVTKALIRAIFVDF